MIRVYIIYKLTSKNLFSKFTAEFWIPDIWPEFRIPEKFCEFYSGPDSESKFIMIDEDINLKFQKVWQKKCKILPAILPSCISHQTIVS